MFESIRFYRDKIWVSRINVFVLVFPVTFKAKMDVRVATLILKDSDIQASDVEINYWMNELLNRGRRINSISIS